MQTPEIDEKPYYEIIAGERIVKYGPMTPERTNQSLTRRMAELLREWAGSRAEVLADRRFRMPSDEKRESYIPDVSLLFFESVEGCSDADLENPLLAPDIAVEVRSPDDKPVRLVYKIATMLANGTRLVLDIDPVKRIVRSHGRNTAGEFHDGDLFSHEAAPAFAFDVTAFFESSKLPAR